MPIRAFHSLATGSANDNVGTATPWIPTELGATPFNIGFGIEASGNAEYHVQHVFTDPSAAAVAFVHSDATAVEADFDGNYAFPCVAIRLRLASAAVSGRTSARFFLIQSEGGV